MRILDQHVRPIDALVADDRPDMVVIEMYIARRGGRTSWPTHSWRAGFSCCWAGLHVTSLPDEAAKHADAPAVAGAWFGSPRTTPSTYSWSVVGPELSRYARVAEVIAGLDADVVAVPVRKPSVHILQAYWAS